MRLVGRGLARIFPWRGLETAPEVLDLGTSRAIFGALLLGVIAALEQKS